MISRKTKILVSPRAASVKPQPVAAPTPTTLGTAPIALKLVAPTAKQVAIAGSFNEWTPAPLTWKPTKGGEWVGELRLAPGKYEYLFIVDGKWLPDPATKDAVPNPFGGMNSVLSVS